MCVCCGWGCKRKKCTYHQGLHLKQQVQIWSMFEANRFQNMGAGPKQGAWFHLMFPRLLNACTFGDFMTRPPATELFRARTAAALVLVVRFAALARATDTCHGMWCPKIAKLVYTFNSYELWLW